VSDIKASVKICYYFNSIPHTHIHIHVVCVRACVCEFQTSDSKDLTVKYCELLF